MAENSGNSSDDNSTSKETNATSAVTVEPLKMSFADWKKNKEISKADAPTTTHARKPHKNENKQQCNNRNNKNSPNNNANVNVNNNNINNNNYNNHKNNAFPPLTRPPSIPFPLMMGFGNFGPGPGPCRPPMLPPACKMGPGPKDGPQHARPLQPPPFWEDMMSPQHQAPPIQPPMPKCPSLWNLVPKDNPTNQQHKNKKQQNQTNNKKYKMNKVDDSSNDSVLMPPPPVPCSSISTKGNSSNKDNIDKNNGSNNAKANGVVKKKTSGGTYLQVNGKWIKKPEAPLPLEEAPPGTKEDRQRQWKEYRQAMKPFKNREFHNWKRTVQRLSKLPRDELDERQLERLQKAEEYIGNHKAMLTVKHAEHWVQQNTQKSNGGSDPSQGQVYVRKPVNAAWGMGSSNQKTSFYRGPVSVQNQLAFGTGRAIKGGIGADIGNLPALSISGPPPPPPPPPLSHGQYSDLTCPSVSNSYFGHLQGINTSLYGQESANSSHNSNPFYASYHSNFKAGSLLPP